MRSLMSICLYRVLHITGAIYKLTHTMNQSRYLYEAFTCARELFLFSSHTREELKYLLCGLINLISVHVRTAQVLFSITLKLYIQQQVDTVEG
jgi:hypothetical protein